MADVSARLVQLVPNAFVVRMTRALRRRRPPSTRRAAAGRRAARACRCACGPSSAARGCRPARRSDLPTGSVVELDREVDDPVDLYVDGLHFATGRLRVAEDGSLQLEVERSSGSAAPPP